MEIRWSNRTYLRKNQITAFHTSYGPGHENAYQDIGENPDPSLFRGFLITEPADIQSICLSYRPSSNSSNLAWQTRLIKRSADGNISTLEFPEITPQSTDHQLTILPVDDFYVEPGDVLALAFKRTTTSGSSNYYLYLDAAIKLRTL